MELKSTIYFILALFESMFYIKGQFLVVLFRLSLLNLISYFIIWIFTSTSTTMTSVWPKNCVEMVTLLKHSSWKIFRSTKVLMYIISIQLQILAECKATVFYFQVFFFLNHDLLGLPHLQHCAIRAAGMIFYSMI